MKLKYLPKHSKTVALGALFLSTSAIAQKANFAIEEIIVTAQMRSESVQDVPISISAVNEDMLIEVGATRIRDLIPMVPGLTGVSFGVATNVWAIRGISSNDFSLGSEPSVGTFLDDAYTGRNGLSTNAFFDVSHIEVVKGPQGSLFGRNASAGAISTVTNKPQDENTLHLGVSAGNEGQQEYRLAGNPALSDELVFRLAYLGRRLEGGMTNVAQNEDSFSNSDSVRLTMRWAPADNLETLLALNYNDGERNIGHFYNPSLSTVEPGEMFPERIATSVPEIENNKMMASISGSIGKSTTLCGLHQ